MGSTDKIVRLVLAAVVGVLYYTKQIDGTTAIVLGAVALIFALTSFISFCPLYTLFGVSTCKKN